MDLEDRKTVCRVCLKQFARYICPRCNISYCGLPCYKQHSEHCTEAFYREQAVGQLKGTKADRDEKKKVLRALRRVQLQQEKDEAKVAAFAKTATQQGIPGEISGMGFNGVGTSSEDEENSDDLGSEEEKEECGSKDEDGSNLESDSEEGVGDSSSGEEGGKQGMLSKKTLHRLVRKAEEGEGDLSQADLEQLLSPSDLRAFQRQLAAGRLAHLVQPWVPWWLSKEAQGVQLSAAGGRLVQEGEQVLQNEGQGGVQAEAEGMVEEGGVRGAERQWEGSEAGRQEQQGMPEGVESIEEGGSRLPEPPEEPLHPLSSLTKAKPSPLLQWQAVELLYAYCHVMRQYNGEAVQPEMVAEAVEAVLHLSQALANCMPARGSPGRTSSSAHAGASSASSAGRAQGQPGPCSSSSSGSASRPVEEMHGGRPPSAAHAAPSPPGAIESAYAPPESAAQVVLSCLERACLPPVGDLASRTVAVAVLSDVAAILSLGSPGTVLSFTDLRRLITRACAMWGAQVQELKQEVQDQQQLLQQQQQQIAFERSSFQQLRQYRAQRGQQQLRQLQLQQQQQVQQQTRQLSAMTKRHALLQAISRKLWFFMCWAHEHRNDDLFEGRLRAAVLEQWHQHQASVKPKSKQETLIASMADNSRAHVRPLIVEQQ